MSVSINQLRSYSVVILTSTGGVISRNAGTDLTAATLKAKARRNDFPDAKEVRVVCSRDGVISTH